MKRILLLIIAGIASSCALQKYNESYFMADFRPYSEEGFTISPFASYAAPYKSIAVISIEVTPGVDDSRSSDVTITKNGQRQGDLYSTPSLPGQWRHPSPEEMLDKLVNYAKSLGANGLLDCNFQEIRFDSKAYRGRETISSYRWSGFAVEL